MRRTLSVLATLLTVFLSGAIVFAETVVINHISRGWYAETGLHVPMGITWSVIVAGQLASDASTIITISLSSI
jgi:hypothetical protein